MSNKVLTQEKQIKKEQYNNHVKNLEVLGLDSLHVSTLYGLEKKGQKMAEDECNGVKEYTDEEWNKLEADTRALFSKYLNGFILNHDPRGY